jgi:hypothetical protein
VCLAGQAAAAETCATLGSTGLVLAIEEAHEVVDHGKGVTIILEPEGRSPRVIGIQPADGVEPLGGVVLANGMTLDYETKTEEAVGSGGAVAGLVGALSGTSVFAVVCSMQSEFPDAEWCLPYLGRLRTEAEACPKEK